MPQIVCVVILLILMSIVPLSSYFGLFRRSDESQNDAQQQQQQSQRQTNFSAGDFDIANDHATRSKLWKKYVGREPLVHGKIVQKPIPTPGVLSNLLAKRERYEKPTGGYFIQHPQDAQVWLEIMPNDVATSYSWKVTETSVDPSSGRRVLNCDDYSMPKRKDFKLRLELPRAAATSADGANYAVLMSLKWAPAQPLKCRNTGCVVTTSQETPSARIVYKSNGGVFYERAGGDVWSESNADGGQLIFNWGVVRERESEILLQDASRAMWLQIKPAPPRNGTLARGVVLLATGSPGSFGGEPIDDKGEWSPWSLLSNACDPKLTCKTALKMIDAERKAKGLGPPLHIVFRESRFFLYWYNISQTLSKRGSVTRLLTAAHGDHLMNEINTFVAKPPVEYMAHDGYVPYNKITSVKQWIEAKHDELPPDAIVVIIDVDVVLLEDISFLAVGVERGKPRGAKGFMSFANDDSPYDRMITRYCKGCKSADPLAVPYFIHKTDLLNLAPRWLAKCKELRDDTLPWHTVKDWRAFKPLQLSWTAEQWAYLLAAAEMGLRHDIREDMSSFTGCGVLQLDEPMIHFSDWTKGVRDGQVFKWSKGMHDALNLIPDVDDKNPCEIDRAMINALKDARANVKPTGHVFKNPHSPEF